MLKGLIILGLAILASIMNGIAISWLWYWFIVPMNSMIPVISFLWAWGLTITIQMLCGTLFPETKDSEEDDTTKFLKFLFETIFRAPFVLFVGWVIHSVAF